MRQRGAGVGVGTDRAAIGPAVDAEPVDIVVLATAAFFLPAAALSASTPLVAKLCLRSLEHTGSVFVLPSGQPPGRPRNQVLVASDAPLPRLALDEADGILLDEVEVPAHVDGADVLSDDHAPADQLAAR